MTTIIGIIGMILILFAFLMNQLHKWKNDYLIYDSFNFVGGLLLVIYSISLNSYPFLILNVVWTGISIRDVIYDLSKTKKGKSYLHHKRR